MRRFLAAVALLALVVACSSAHERGFAEACSEDDDCQDGLACATVSRTAHEACANGASTARFCSRACKEHKDCDGLLPPGGATAACVRTCSGAAACAWVGAK